MVYGFVKSVCPVPENWRPVSFQWDYSGEIKPRVPSNKLIWERETRGQFADTLAHFLGGVNIIYI